MNNNSEGEKFQIKLSSRIVREKRLCLGCVLRLRACVHVLFPVREFREYGNEFIPTLRGGLWVIVIVQSEVVIFPPSARASRIFSFQNFLDSM